MRLREESLRAEPYVSAERAEILTQFYRESEERDHPAPIQRALAFRRLCAAKSVHVGDEEMIVGERGPAPKATPTFPELTCHSLDDLAVLDTREKTRYAVSPHAMRIYREEIIPYWRGRSLRDRIFMAMTDEWKAAYEAGVFTEFMEQRAPGHTVADGKIYRLGLAGLLIRIDAALVRLHGRTDQEAERERSELTAMGIAARAAIHHANRHADRALEMAAAEPDTDRRAELLRIAKVCRRVPQFPARDFHEALQAYWFVHLAVITELNGWDSFSPGHLDQHLGPFYDQGLADGTLTREDAKELLGCFFVKFNNHPAPPKVGVTAAESGTYTDFANINLAGLLPDGADGVNEVSYLLLEVIEELHILQPSQNVQISRATPDAFLEAACRVIRKGYGYPSVFNADMVVREMLRQGKSIEDAREGGTSGCVETGAFGKEAYILTGYLNLPKLLEIACHDGIDPRTGRRIGPATGTPEAWNTYDDLFAAWEAQLRHAIDVKIEGNSVIERLYAHAMPAPFLSVITDDCIAKGRDYNAGGARYNTAYIQGVGIGTLTDSLAAIRTHVYEQRTVPLARLLSALREDFRDEELLRQRLLHRSPKWGNDDEEADGVMRACFDALFRAVDGRPNERGGTYHVDMLPTTCHVYFGSVCGATADGRRSGVPLSEGISPVQGMDRKGPTAVLLSAAKMDHERTGGTLLNMKFSPAVLEGENGIRQMAALIRTYFRLGGHHIQFNVVTAETLRRAQREPERHRDLIVRVAGYSDYFCDLGRILQDEIIERTEQTAGG